MHIPASVARKTDANALSETTTILSDAMLASDQKGAIAETAIAHAATKLGIGVYKPVTEGRRCDLIFDLGTKLVRVQCKWASRRGDVLGVRCYSSRRSASGFLKRSYTSDEVDAIAA